MKVGLIGLGRMGLAIASRLISAGHELAAYDKDQEASQKAAMLGATILPAEEIAGSSSVVWLMLPAGKVIDSVLQLIKPNLVSGSVVVDGGNSQFEDSIRRAKELEAQKVFYLDCGTSGGLKGEEIGFSLMIGGAQEAYEKARPVFEAVAAKEGFGLVGPSGSGHCVKMVHNGIEYALLQSYAEGFHLLKEGRYKELDLSKISSIWSNGSVIRSWILELCSEIFQQDQELKDVPGAIGENQTGRWAIEEAEKQGINFNQLKEALNAREWSRKTGGNYATKLVAMLRKKFGGHKLEKK